jgi:hypothetical protein
MIHRQATQDRCGAKAYRIKSGLWMLGSSAWIPILVCHLSKEHEGLHCDAYIRVNWRNIDETENVTL